MHIRGSVQIEKELQLLNPGGTSPADGLIALSDAEGNLRWSHLVLPALDLDSAYPKAGTLIAYKNKVYYSLIPNAEGGHIVDPGVWKDLTAAAPDQDALTQDQKDAIAASVEPSAGNAYVTKKEVHNLIIKGSETVAIILTKSPLVINNLWIATTDGFDSFEKPVLTGDGLASTGTEWINIGAIRGPISFADAPQNDKVYTRKNAQWQELIHQNITGKEDLINKGVALGYVPLNGVAKVAAEFLDIINNLTTGGTAAILSAEQGKVLKQQIDAITVLLASDDVNMDTVQELVNALKEVPTILVDDLTTGGVTKALTAEQGVVLKALIDNLPKPSLQDVVTVASNLTDKIITSINTVENIGYSEIHANRIIFTESSVLANQVNTSVLSIAGLTIKNTVSKTEATINSTGLVISTLSDVSGYGSTVSLKRHTDMPLESNIAIVLQAPNKLSGTYTLAVIDEIPFEKVNEGKGDGYVVRGRTPDNYGAVGEHAFDLSFSSTVSTLFGATGTASFCTGYQNIASGYGTSVFGGSNISKGVYSIVSGIYQNEAAGYANVLFGVGHSVTNGAYVTIVGQFANVVTNNLSNVNDAANTMFAVGNGMANGSGLLQSRSTAFQVYKNGAVIAPSLTAEMITADTTGKMLVTKEYVTAAVPTLQAVTNKGNITTTAIIVDGIMLAGKNFRSTFLGKYFENNINCTSTEAVAIGYGAGAATNGSQLVAIGMSAGSRSNGNNLIAIGAYTADQNIAQDVTAIGAYAASSNTFANTIHLSAITSNIQGTQATATHQFIVNTNGFNLRINTSLVKNLEFSMTQESGLIPSVGYTAPASSSATGVKGEIRVTATYVYHCINTNIWVREAVVSSF